MAEKTIDVITGEGGQAIVAGFLAKVDKISEDIQTLRSAIQQVAVDLGGLVVRVNQMQASLGTLEAKNIPDFTGAEAGSTYGIRDGVLEKIAPSGKSVIIENS